MTGASGGSRCTGRDFRLAEALARLEPAVSGFRSALHEARATPGADAAMTIALATELDRLERELTRLQHEHGRPSLDGPARFA
jgi:hypothetical protein